MHDPVIADPAPNHAQHRRLFLQRLFSWGLWFWILTWCFSFLVHLQFVVNLKGWWGMRLFMGAGSVGVMFDSYSTGTFNYIRLEEPLYLWSQPYLDRFRQNPGDFFSVLGRVGWSGYGFYHTMALPIAGFLWLWLIRAWIGDLKRFRWAKFRQNGPMIGRATILVFLPLIILIGDYKQRRANEAAGCILYVRNIQQAVRSHSGVRAMNIGDKIHWEEIIGPGRYFESYARICPCGESYRLSPVVPGIGVLAAECPNPEHQRRLKASAETSEW